MEVSRCFLVAVDIQVGEDGNDSPVVIVGEKTSGVDVQIINAFHGDEAMELYKKLITKEKGVKTNG